LVLAAGVLDFAEEHFTAAAHVLRVVDTDVVVLGVEGFLDEWFLQFMHLVSLF
jgi:hypothetical protein